MALSTPTRHVSLCGGWRLCNICGNKLNFGDSFVALAGNMSSTTFEKGFINRLTMWNNCRERVWYLCRVLPCSKNHTPARSGAVFHPECLRIFMRYCSSEDALDQLWQTCTWRSFPWEGVAVPKLGLLPRTVRHLTDAFVLCARICRLISPATSLPQVVLGIIMESLPRDHLFWRYVFACDLALRLCRAQSQALSIIPLDGVVSWVRGAAPELALDGSLGRLPPIIRLTLDHDGLKKLERLPERPWFRPRQFDDQVFIVGEEDSFGWTTSAKFKNGHLQLAMPGDGDLGSPGFTIWDTPTPPDLDACRVRPAQPHSSFRYHTIDLSAVTGITFFHAARKFVAIHAHTKRQPCAMATYATLEHSHSEADERLTWIYVPLPRGDTILSCGPLVRRVDLARWRISDDRDYAWASFLIRQRLSGEVMIGRNLEDKGKYGYLLNGPEERPRTLVYSVGSDGSSTSIVVALNESGVQSGRVEEPRYNLPDDLHPRMQHSYASLENVASVCVYYRPGTGLCRGILFYYDNGGQRAVGQCRLHVDPCETYKRPSSIALLQWSSSLVAGSGGYPRENTRVRFNGPGRHPGQQWAQYAMTGTLECWFTAQTMKLSVEGGTLIP